MSKIGDICVSFDQNQQSNLVWSHYFSAGILICASMKHIFNIYNSKMLNEPEINELVINLMLSSQNSQAMSANREYLNLDIKLPAENCITTK